MNEPSPAVALFTELIRQAEAAGASDVHLQRVDGGARVAFRLDGLLTPVREIPGPLAEHLFGRIKYLARLKTYQDSLPQDGRIDQVDSGAAGDMRVATYPTVTGEKIVLRLFQSTSARTLDELEFPPGAVDELRAFLRQENGMLLLTGPAGSGKTTTIYACLRQLAAGGGRHVITIEDPAEQVLPGIMQTEVNEAAGLTFAVAARHLLRQDPQVLALGEIRDDETATLAVRAALTGHLVISTLHAGSCRGVLERLLVMCPDRGAATSALALVLNQRLMRRRCGDCAGRGCAACLQTGYRGRIPLVEWVRLDDEARRRWRAGEAEAVTPVRSLADAARDLVARSLSDQAEHDRILGL